MKLIRFNEIQDLRCDGTYEVFESFLMPIGIVKITKHPGHEDLTIIDLSSGNHMIVDEPIDQVIKRIEGDSSSEMKTIPKKKNLKLVEPVELDEEDGETMATATWGGAGPDCKAVPEGVRLRSSRFGN